MASQNRQLMEISRRIKNNPEASLLLDQFLDACFDSVPAPDWAPVKSTPAGARERSERLAAALAQLNAYLKQCAIVPEGLQPPADRPLNVWAEDLTMELLTNSCC